MMDEVKHQPFLNNSQKRKMDSKKIKKDPKLSLLLSKNKQLMVHVLSDRLIKSIFFVCLNVLIISICNECRKT